MIYSNDETDKGLRQKNYIIFVYLLPVFFALCIAGVFYLLSKNDNIGKFDNIFGYYIAFMVSAFVYIYNKNKWLKMPDGTFHYIKGITPQVKISNNEPNEYSEEYFISKKEKIISTALGVFMFCVGVFLGIKNVRGILLPIFISGCGAFLSYVSIKALLDKTPILRLAKEGLWTTRLGFVSWKDLSKTQVVIEKGRSPQTILEVYLKGTVFAEANKPDERLNITAVTDKEFIETVIDNYIFKSNEVSK